jgi:AbrB family looped-hinge helix DNA binding protein
MLTSRITQKGQTTIPRQVRARLEVHPGDQIVYESTASGFVIRKIRPFEASWHAGIEKSLEAEWNSPEDDEDFRDL